MRSSDSNLISPLPNSNQGMVISPTRPMPLINSLRMPLPWGLSAQLARSQQGTRFRSFRGELPQELITSRSINNNNKMCSCHFCLLPLEWPNAKSKWLCGLNKAGTLLSRALSWCDPLFCKTCRTLS